MKPNPNQTIRYLKYSKASVEQVDSGIINEASVSLTVNGEVWLSFMCTPIDLEALAVGFLYNEGIIQSYSQVAIIKPCDNGDNVDIWLNHPVQKPPDWRRTSGCTGGITSVSANHHTPPADHLEIVPPDTLLGCMDRLFDSQEIYRQVRGVHCSMLTDGDKILAMAEDIGRHNTLDKITGKLLIDPVPGGLRILLTTGRISSEMLQKSAKMGASIVVSRTSPSSLSIEMAHDLGITLVGYARRSQFNVYAHPERLGLPAFDQIPILINKYQPLSR